MLFWWRKLINLGPGIRRDTIIKIQQMKKQRKKEIEIEHIGKISQRRNSIILEEIRHWRVIFVKKFVSECGYEYDKYNLYHKFLNSKQSVHLVTAKEIDKFVKFWVNIFGNWKRFSK